MHPEEGPGHEEDEGGAVGEILPKGKSRISQFGGSATSVSVSSISRTNKQVTPPFTQTIYPYPPTHTLQNIPLNSSPEPPKGYWWVIASSEGDEIIVNNSPYTRGGYQGALPRGHSREAGCPRCCWGHRTRYLRGAWGWRC